MDEHSDALERAVSKLPPKAKAVLLEVRNQASSSHAVDQNIYQAVARKLALDPIEVEKLWCRALEYLLEQT